MYGVDLHHAKVLVNISIENEFFFLENVVESCSEKYLLYNIHDIVVYEERQSVLLLVPKQPEGRLD